MTARGSCLCGAVTFEVAGTFRRANYCHCSRCRKHSGSIGLAQARIAREDFRLLTGEDALVTYRPRDAMAKVFCRHCGSSLFGGTWPDKPEISIRLGAFDEDPQISPQYRSFCSEAVPWLPLPNDTLERTPGRSPNT